MKPATPDAITRRDFVRSGLAACTAATMMSSSRFASPQTGAAADPPATHNMLAVGQSSLFLSHLPMFNQVNAQQTDYVTPHRFQVILEAKLIAPSGDPQKTYLEDRRDHPEVRMYTLQPKPFVLASLFPSGQGASAATSFPAQGLFRGHLERAGNVQIAKGFTVQVVKVFYAVKFDVKQAKSDTLEYLIFGSGDELFAAHRITAPPDFDQVLPVRIVDRKLSPQQLAAGVRVSVRNSSNTATARLGAGQTVAADLIIGTAPVANIKLQAMRELYFEEGELFIPPQFPQTPEEKKAGFTEEGQ